MLLQDFVFLDEMAHFNRERIPERVVGAKGAGNSTQNYDDLLPLIIVQWSRLIYLSVSSFILFLAE